MRREPLRIVGLLGLVLAACAACAFAWASRPGGRSAEPREIVIVARGMTFTVPGTAGSNPTLRLKAGERIRLVLENRDPGMKHDVTSPGLGFRTATIDFAETHRQEISVPRAPGTYDYFCTYHDKLMRGRMVVD